MKKWFEPIEVLEEKEEQLRQKVNALPSDAKKQYYQLQGKQLKDPDTYAALNWLFLGGAHHLYLGKYLIFAIEFSLLIVSITLAFAGHLEALFILVGLSIYEAPQLFFSQRIARAHNYQLCCQLYEQLRTDRLSS
uniref:hypothetical protein n=1 Tax=Thaumasiovibrio occultus TaxID=1891184 RepID=UPI000B356509|nr:hypothetical protein [Thaumasiovibrio occultus]